MGPRFGVTVIPSASGRSDPVAEAVLAEELGFDLVTVWDHPNSDQPSFETWTLMTWMASRTSRISIGSNVLGLPFRLPALTAKMAESLSRLSGGRLILGMGAGGSDEEIAAYGGPARAPADKVEALQEALEIIRGVWAEPTFTYDGRYYRNDRAVLEPKPDAEIRIWLGAYGPRALELTGRSADGWIPSMGFLPPSKVPSRIGTVRAAAEGAGRDPASLDYAYNVRVRVGGGGPNDPERIVAGEPDEVVERLLELLDLGFTVLNLWPSGGRTDQLERLAAEVLPEIRRVATGE